MLLLCSFAMLSAALQWEEAIAIRQGVNIEWFRTGTATNDGGAIYVWSDTKNGERDLWAQKVDANGNMIWNDPVLIDGKPDRQEDPVIAATSDGNYIIAWIDFSDDLDGNVYAQKINNQGQLMWQAGGKPVCTIPSEQLGLNMEADSNGGVFIVWGDSRNTSKDLYAQRLSATGDPLWTVNGIPVANGPGDEIQNTMLPDGQGGMMMAYTHTYASDSDIYAKHFDGNGNMTWTQEMALAVAPGPQTGVRMAAIGNGEFIFTWSDQRNTDTDIYGQKVNIAGQKMWSEPYIVFSDQSATLPAAQSNPRIQSTSDGGAVIVWEDFRLDSQNAELYAQKLNSAGTKLWGEAAIAITTADFSQSGQRIAADNNGGVYIVWDDLRNGNTPNDDIYAQHLSASGEALWTAGGKPICTAPFTQNGGLVKVAGDNIYINWMDARNGSIGIYYQVLDASGNLQLAENGVEVFWGLSGDTPINQYQILARDNDTVIIWQDTRYASEGYRLFFQFLNEDGQTLLETNGRPITLEGLGHQKDAHATVTEDGHIAIVWRDERSGTSTIYAQLISPAGDRLWGDNGMRITETDPLSHKDPRISYYNNSFYIGWSELEAIGINFSYHVFGQRLVNGEKMWGPNGKVISILTGSSRVHETTLTDIIDDVYVWHKVITAIDEQTIWAKRVDENGDAFAGWPNAGLQTTSMADGIVQLSPTASRSNNGVYVTWRDNRFGPMQYCSQLISPAGERLWGEEGIFLSNSGNEQEYAKTAVAHNGIVTTWCENINGMHDIKAKKLFWDGSDLWSESGYFIVQKDSTQSKPTLVGFDGAGMMTAWVEYFTEDSDIYYNYINADGNVVLDSQGAVLTNAGKSQYDPIGVELNDNAYVIWADGRSSGKTEILGLYAMKVNNESVSVNDPVTPSVMRPTLKQNYPNPFNPHTSIALTMPTNGDIKLKIYNAKGQLVKTLFDGSLEKGEHSFSWDGKDHNGKSVSSGMYFYSAQNAKGTQSRKMILMK